MYLRSLPYTLKPMPRLLLGFRSYLKPAALAFTLITSACAEPPAKEMHQAQGAIDAARAAGAEEYAAEELKLAVDGLAKYQEAVEARDFRLALAHALDSRERAQNAAKTAVDGRAKARGDAERELAEAVALVERARTRLRGAEVVKLPKRTVAKFEEAIAATSESLQEARSALTAEEYRKVGAVTEAVTTRVQALLTDVETALKPPAKGRGRR
jgi:hypothetical protein